jgi:hypothetical protein
VIPSAVTGTIAQDWTDIESEWARSAFDQRHLVTAQLQFTSGVGVGGGALLTGATGALAKGWTLTVQLTAGSGLLAAPDGYYLNPAAYTTPPAGAWGSAGRHSVSGPQQFNMNAGITRSFPVGDRVNLDWRIDAINVLNRVTHSSVNAFVGSPQFGLPNGTNPMRKIETSFRLRF